MDLAQQVDNYDKLRNIRNIKNEIQISKVVLYFSNIGIEIPKTTISNYVREGVIDKLVNDRYYTHKHIIQIYIALTLKQTFSLNEIKKILKYVDGEYSNEYEMYEKFCEICNTYKECVNTEELFIQKQKINNLDTYISDIIILYFMEKIIKSKI